MKKSEGVSGEEATTAAVAVVVVAVVVPAAVVVVVVAVVVVGESGALLLSGDRVMFRMSAAEIRRNGFLVWRQKQKQFLSFSLCKNTNLAASAFSSLEWMLAVVVVV